MQDFIPKGRKNRPGYKLTPKYVTIHNTANPNATAKNHASYIKTQACADRLASWHFTVDHLDIAYQHLPLNENAWHCTDGTNGTGNRQSIGIEICEFTDKKKQDKAIDNGAWLCAKLLKDYSLSISRVKQHNHWYNKNCPRVIRARKNGWADFLKAVEGYLKPKPAPKPKPSDTIYRVVSGSYLDWDDAESQAAKLKKAGFDSFFAGFKHDGKHYIRVVCGSYADRANADKQISALKAKGFDSFIAIYEGKDDPLPAKSEPKPEIDLSKVIFRVIINGVQVVALTGFDNAKEYALEKYPYDKIELQNVETSETTKIQNAKEKPAEPKPEEPEPEPDPKPEYKYKIVGKSVATSKQAIQWAKSKGAHQRFIDIAPTYWVYGDLTGLRADILYAQAGHETNFGKFTGAVIPEQNNWAGIKIKNPTGDARDDHEYFEMPEDGVRGHFNHMCAYVGAEPLGEPHDRYYIALSTDWAGEVKYLEELSGKWAPSTTYHTKIVQFLEEMIATPEPEPEPEPKPEQPEDLFVPDLDDLKLEANTFLELLKVIVDAIAKWITKLIKGGK